jgi:hypothetical protein
VKGGVDGDIVGKLGRTVLEVVCCDRSRGWEWDGGVRRGEEKIDGKDAQTAQVIDCEGNESDVVVV